MILEKNIELQKRNVAYTLRVSRRAKHVRLTVCCGGAFTVTTPRHVSLGAIERFIVKKASWVLGKIDHLSTFAAPVKASNARADFLKYKDIAQKLVEEKLAKFNAVYGYTYNKVTIRNQKSRWGSCSRKGNLNFNYKIALLPEYLAEYIVVHELCHLEQLNHSHKFWDLVAQTVPDHKKCRVALRKNPIIRTVDNIG